MGTPPSPAQPQYTHSPSHRPPSAEGGAWRVPERALRPPKLLQAPGRLRRSLSGLPALPCPWNKLSGALCAQASNLVRGRALRPPWLPDTPAGHSVLTFYVPRTCRVPGGEGLHAGSYVSLLVSHDDLGPREPPVTLSPPLPPGAPDWAALGR